MNEELQTKIVIRDGEIVAYKESGIVNRLAGVTVSDDEFIDTDKNIVIVNGRFLFDDSEEYTNEQLNSYKKEQIAELKAELSTYDYIGVKIAMGVATREEYAEQIAYTETLRARINELQE